MMVLTSVIPLAPLTRAPCHPRTGAHSLRGTGLSCRTLLDRRGKWGRPVMLLAVKVSLSDGSPA